MNDSNETPPDDIDQKIRINELKEEIRDLGGTGFQAEGLPPDLEEAFLANVLAYETGEFIPQIEIVKRNGLTLPDAATMTDMQVSEKLKALIARLTEMRTFLSHTNHLSDRELYEWLCKDGLMEEVIDMKMPEGSCNGLDVLGSYGEEQVDLYNRYYATEEQRAEHKKEYPDWPLPPHEDPKHDRDRFLPQAEF